MLALHRRGQLHRLRLAFERARGWQPACVLLARRASGFAIPVHATRLRDRRARRLFGRCGFGRLRRKCKGEGGRRERRRHRRRPAQLLGRFAIEPQPRHHGVWRLGDDDALLQQEQHHERVPCDHGREDADADAPGRSRQRRTLVFLGIPHSISTATAGRRTCPPPPGPAVRAWSPRRARRRTPRAAAPACRSCSQPAGARPSSPRGTARRAGP